MLDKTAVLREAQKYLAKGAADRAISELEKLVKESPDGNTFNMIGDIYLKKGSQRSATENYLKAANFFRQEGFSQKAQALYKKVLNINPADTDALRAFGEICEEKGMIAEAIKYYLAVADLLSKEGKKDKILEIYEKILSLSPANVPLRVKVAEIYIKEGLKSDGAKEFIKIAAIYDEKEEHEKAREFLQKALFLQPLNKEAVLGLSIIYEKTGEIRQAMEHIRESALLFPEDLDILMRHTELAVIVNDNDLAKKCLHKIIEKDPGNVKARRMLGEIYMSSGSIESAWTQYFPMLDEILSDQSEEDAINFLSTFREAEPLETGKRLVNLYRGIGNDDLAVTELLRLSDIHSEKGADDEAKACLEEAARISPGHPEVMGRLAPQAPESEPELTESQVAVPEMAEPEFPQIEIPETWEPETSAETELPSFEATGLSRDAEEMISLAETEKTAAETSSPEPFDEPEQPSTPEKSFDEIITEADIFSRYGLFSETQRLLEGLKLKFPDSIDLHLRLKSVYVELKDRESAVTEFIILSELYKRKGEPGNAEQALKDALELSPEDPRLASRSYSSFVEQTSYAEGMGESLAEKELNIEDYEEELAEADFYKRQGLASEAINILEKLQRLFPESREVNDRLIALGQAGASAEEDELDIRTEMPETFEIADFGEKTVETVQPEEFAADDIFHIADSEEEQKLPDEEMLFETAAEDKEITVPVIETVTEDIFEAKPSATPAAEPEITEPAFEPEPAAATEIQAPEPEPQPPSLHREQEKEQEYEEFTFSASDLVEAQEMPEPALDNDVLDIFREFKKGLEKELGDEDSETHYNLGIAYKEMGLVDDAIKEFQTSRTDPKRFMQSSTMLGVCYMEKGLYTLAIDVLTKASEKMTEKDESYWALTYELAEAYEKNLNIQEALNLYTAVYGWNARFRSVSDKIAELGSKTQRRAEQGKDIMKDKPKERKDRVSYL